MRIKSLAAIRSKYRRNPTTNTVRSASNGFTDLPSVAQRRYRWTPPPLGPSLLTTFAWVLATSRLARVINNPTARISADVWYLGSTRSLPSFPTRHFWQRDQYWQQPRPVQHLCRPVIQVADSVSKDLYQQEVHLVFSSIAIRDNFSIRH